MALCKKLFWVNPYLKRCKVVVLQVSENEVLFDKTIVFHVSGGQESDHGTIDGKPILSSRRDGLDIWYDLGDDHGLSTGQSVTMEIDWERRQRLMRYHMLCELILAMVNRHFGNIEDKELAPSDIDSMGIVKVMAKMGDRGAYVDFDHPGMADSVPTFQRELDRLIKADLPIEKGWLDESNQKRYWRITGYATIPCGGTHITSTGKIGMAVLKREKTTSKATESGRAERIKVRLVDESPIEEGQIE